MIQILDELDDGCDAHSVNDALKRYEAIHTDVNARVSCKTVHVIFMFRLSDCSVRCILINYNAIKSYIP